MAAADLTFNVAGVTFDNRRMAIADLRPGQVLRLVREPDNAHDKNAVAVEDGIGRALGYVPRGMTRQLLGASSAIVVEADPGFPYLKIRSQLPNT